MNFSAKARIAATTCLMVLLIAVAGELQAAVAADEASALEEQARTLSREARYSEATSLARRALALRRSSSTPQQRDIASSLEQLATLLCEKGAYAEAEERYGEAVSIRDRVLGPLHPDTASVLDRVGVLYRHMGRFGRAEVLHQRALSIRRAAFGENHLDTARSLHNLGTLYNFMGKQMDAEALYEKALAIRRRLLPPTDADIGVLLNNLAGIYLDTGDFDKAARFHKQALSIREAALGSRHPDTAQSLINVADANRLADPRIDTESLYRRGIEIYESTHGPEHQLTAYGWARLAELYADRGAYGEALAIHERVLETRRRVLGENHASTAISLRDLAGLHARHGRYGTADSLLSRAVRIREYASLADEGETARYVSDLGVMKWLQGHRGAALSLLQRAQRIQERSNAQFFASQSESRKRAYVHALSKNLFRLVSFSLAVQGPQSAELGMTGTLSYKGMLDAAAEHAARGRQNIGSRDRITQDRLGEIARELSVLTYRTAGQLSTEEYIQRAARLSDEREKLDAEMARRSGERFGAASPVDLSRVRDALPRDAVLLEWVRYSRFTAPRDDAPEEWRYAVYVLKKAGPVVAVDLGAAAQAERLMHEFRLAASNRRRDDVKQIAADLSDSILGPIRKYLAGSRHLLIAPDGDLNLIPLAALVDQEGRYLATQFEITVLTSGQDLLRIAARSAVPSQVSVVLGNPNYGARVSGTRYSGGSADRSRELDRSGLTFGSLPGTLIEVDAIRELLRGERVELLTQDDATEENLKRVHGPRILHLATHGFFLRDQNVLPRASHGPGAQKKVVVENPWLRSGLALSGANLRQSGRRDDGILTALEASSLDLRGTQLVVLSACDTGMGDVRNGEGVVGLRRGLSLAGAQTQIVSLWKISDSATAKLIADYYRHLVRRGGRSAALRHSQLEMLRAPATSHPYYWAGFVAVGDWRPLS